MVLDADTGAFLQADCALGTDGPLLTIIRCAGVEALLREGLGKDVLHLILAVDDEHPLGLRLKGVDPLQQALPVGVARKAGELADLRLHLDGFAEELHVVRTLQQRAAQRVHGLIAHKEDGAFLPPEVMLEVVADTARFAHAAGRDDDLRHGVSVDGTGLIAGDADLQARELDGVDALCQQSVGLFIKAGGVGVLEDSGGLDGQRAVDVHREAAVAGDQILFLYLADEVEQFLSAAHCKARDDHIAAAVEGALQDLRQLCHIVGPRAVAAVTVGGLHKDIICVFQICGVFDDRLVVVADVAGEDQLCGRAVLRHPYLDAGRAQQMAHIHKADDDAGRKLDLFIVIIAPEQRDGCLGVLNGVHGFHRLCAGALAFAVLPLSFEFLDMRRVAQHDAAQFCRGPGGIDPAPEAVAHQKRQKARVVDMGMGGQHAVDLARRNGDGLVLIDILALFHTTVDEVALSRRFQEGTAAGHFVVGTQKRQFHRHTSNEIIQLWYIKYITFRAVMPPKSIADSRAKRRIHQKFFIQS